MRIGTAKTMLFSTRVNQSSFRQKKNREPVYENTELCFLSLFEGNLICIFSCAPYIFRRADLNLRIFRNAINASTSHNMLNYKVFAFLNHTLLLSFVLKTANVTEAA